MLSGDADANMFNLGWKTTARTDFLWCVNVHIDLPAARSHKRTVWKKKETNRFNEFSKNIAFSTNLQWKKTLSIKEPKILWPLRVDNPYLRLSRFLEHFKINSTHEWRHFPRTSLISTVNACCPSKKITVKSQNPIVWTTNYSEIWTHCCLDFRHIFGLLNQNGPWSHKSKIWMH